MLHILAFLVGLCIVGAIMYIFVSIRDRLEKKRKHRSAIDVVSTSHVQQIMTITGESLEKIHQQREMDKQEMETVSVHLRDVIYNKKDSYLYQNILYCTLIVSNIIEKCNIDNIYAKHIKKNFDTAVTKHAVVENFKKLGLEIVIYKNHIVDIRKI